MSREVHLQNRYLYKEKNGGEEWIRTTVGRSQQIYSLPPLATRAPHHLNECTLNMEPTTELESVTSSLPRKCSTD